LVSIDSNTDRVVFLNTFQAGMEGPPMTEEDRIAKPSLASDEVVQEEEGEIDEQSGSQSTDGSVSSTAIRVEERLDTEQSN
jgi:hypothetical protein